MGLIDKFRDIVDDDMSFIPYLNTGTMVDLATGKFVHGLGDHMYLNGGIHCSTVIGGQTGLYKSGAAGSILARILAIYKEAEGIVFESEQTITSATRYDDFVPIYEKPVSDRILFISSAQMTLDEFYDKVILPYCKERELHKKDYLIESPFLNLKTMKPYLMWKPTIAYTDSWSNATVTSVSDRYEDNKIKTDSSDMNTIFMKEGLVKTRINRTIPTLAAKYGLYFICTAHIDEKKNMSAMAHPTKDMQFMKADQTFKNVGGSFEFLASTLLQNKKATVLLDGNKKSEYPAPHGNAPDTEVNEVSTTFVKVKNNAGGATLPFIVSQYQGILNEVTNYHYLKQMKGYGLLDPNSRSPKLMLYPEKSVTRQNIRKMGDEDYMFRRALELTTQIAFIQNYWFTANMDPSMNMPILEVADRLTGDKAIAKDILNTRGYWTTSKDDRPYMSTVDILSKLSELKSKPKVVDTKK